MTTASKAQYRQNLKRLKSALSGKYKDKPTTQSAYVVGDGHIKIDGRYYDAATSGIAGGTATVVNIGRPAAAVYSTAEGGTVITSGGGGGSGGTTIISGTGGAPVNASYLVIAPDSTLTAERSLLVSTALTMTDTGPNNALTIGMALPQQVSATSANVVTAGHSHQVVASSAPGANEALLKSDGDGALTLVKVTATERLRSPLLDTASGGLTFSPADGTAVLNGSLAAQRSVATEISATTAADGAIPTLALYRARGSVGSPSAAQNGDALGILTFGAYHSGGAYSGISARLGAFATEDHSADARGGALAVFTTETGTTIPADRQWWHGSGNVTVGTSTDSGYKFDVSGTMRATTSLTTAQVISPLLTTASNVDLVINPAGTGAVQFPNDQTLRTSDFDSSFPIEGWQINEIEGVAGYSNLTIGKIKANELSVDVFVANETRVDRGNQYWTKSYGVGYAGFTSPSAIDGTVSIVFEDSPALSGAIFSNDDWLLFQSIDTGTGIDMLNLWGQVSGYVDGTGDDEGTQTWTFTLRSGPTNTPVLAGQVAVDFGASGAALIHLSTIDDAGAPYIKMRRWFGANPYTPSNFTTYVQIGNLGSIGNSYYTPAGYGLYIRSSAAEDQFIVADDNGLQLRGASLTLWDGATQTVNIDNEGVDIWVGNGSDDKLLAWDGSALSLRANNTDVITLDTSGNSYFAGIMTIGASGEIRQGTGTLGSNYTGLRIWRDSSVGRIAGYNNNVQQWYANTDGKLYAGGGTFMADADGIHLGNESYAKGLQLYRTSGFSNSNKAGGLWALSDLGNYVYFYAGRNTGVGDAANATGRLSLIAFNSSGGELSLVIDASSNYATMTGLLRTDTVRPTLTDTYDLGTSSFYYNDAYIRNLHVDTVVGTPAYSHSHAASDITSGTLDLARIPTNLTGKNADLLDGYDATDFALVGHTHGSGVTSIVAGGGIGVSGTTTVTVSHADTSSQTSVDNSNGTVIQDVTLDTYGHVTALASANLDSRYPLITDLAGYVPTTRTVTAGSGLTGGGALSADITISHADTSSQASVDNSGTTFIQDITLDTYGHITAITSVDTATALDGRYVNTTGDTMTGNLIVDIDAIGTSGYIALKTNNTSNHQWQMWATAHDYAVIPEDFFLIYYDGSTSHNVLWIENSSLLATFGGAVSVTGTVTATGAGTFAANTDANNTLGRAIVGYAAAADSATFAHYDYHTSTNFALAQFADGSVQVNAPTGQEISLSVNDVATYSVNADRLLPRSSVQVDLGDYNRKIRTIHAAELAVQTLIAQDVIATVGGQIIVSPTSRLIADISSSGVAGGTDAIYTNLISHWSLDEVSDTRLDSKDTNHLSDRNTVTSTTGKVGVSAVFDKANSERLNITDNTDLSVGDIDFYGCGWFYPTLDDAATHVVASKGGSSGNRAWQLQINWAGSTNRFEFIVYNSSDATTQVNSAAITVDTWYYVEFWHNATTNLIGVAVNGTETTTAHTTGVKTDTGNFTLGALNSGSNYTGRIDEFGFWKSYIPDSTRRTWLYNAGSGRAYTDIYNYGAGAFNMDIEHNSYDVGDFLYMAAAPAGVPQTEVFKITSSASAITGGYRYSAERDLDGSGANNWYAGDAVTSLGGAIGEGYINLTATSTLHGHFGPTIAHYVRRGTGAWDSVAPVVVSGNLRSFLDYAGDEFGHAAGNDLLLTPAEGFRGYAIDTTNGFRAFNLDISLYEEDVEFLNIGTISGIQIETNEFSTNDNRSISFNRLGVNRSHIRTWEASNYNTLKMSTVPATGIDHEIEINAYADAARSAFLTLDALSTGQSVIALAGLATANSSYINLETTGTISLTADLVTSNADIDLNGNDIIDTATISLTGTGQGVVNFAQTNWYIGAISNTDPLINFDAADYITYSRSSNSLALYISGSSRLLIDATNFGFGGASYGSGSGVVFLANRTAAPSSNPSGGGILYVESGSLKFRGSSGTVTSIAPA